MEEKKNLVAVYFKNGLGNFIMMTPAIQALAELYDAKVDIVFDKSWQDSRREGIEEFCGQWEVINEIIEFQDGFDKSKYKILYYARHGETSEAHIYFQNNSMMKPAHVNWRAEKLHEIDYYMNDVRELGYMGKTPEQYCVRGTLDKFRNSINFLAPNEYFRLGICNGFFAGSEKWKWERKGWPHFGELFDLINDYYSGRLRIFLFGKGDVEKKWAKGVQEGRKNVVSFVDRLSLGATIQIMQRMHLFITTDTGLMHIADACNKAMIVLFGPTLLSKNGPYNKNHRVLRSPVKCAPCQQSPHFHLCKEWKCMEALTPDLVMAEMRLYIWDLVEKNKLMTRAGGAEIKTTLL